MSDELNVNELDENERRLFAALPREMALAAGAENDVVRALRAEGVFDQRGRRASWMLRIAAALALIVAAAVAGTFIGGRYAMRRSLEVMLAQDDLTVSERILLLQRAGSAYVQAAHAYADATAKTDSTAIEVARQVLIGAAHAVARSDLDGGVATRLTKVLQEPNAPPIIWY